MALPLTNRDKDLLLSALGLPEVRDRVVALLDLAGTGNMTGPASSTDNALVRFDGATGALVQNSGVLLDDSNNLSGLAALAISGQFQAANGTVGAPSYSFASDLDTGLFLAGSNETRMSNGGTATQIWQAANIFARVPLNAANGSPSAPSYTFENDQDTGIWLAGGAMRFGFGGVEKLQMSPVSVAASIQFGAFDGTVSTPGLSWDNDADTGFYRIGANSVGYAAGGVRIANHTAAGNWGFGAGSGSSPTSDAVMTIGGTAATTASPTGLYLSPTFSTASTSSIAGLVVSARSADGVYTIPQVYSIFPQDVQLGVGASATRQVLFVGIDPVAATHNAVLANNFAFTGNWFINSTSTNPSLFSGTVNFVAPIANRVASIASGGTINALASTSGFIRLGGVSATILNGITAGVDGQNLILLNPTGANLTISHNSGSAAAGNKIFTTTGADVVSTGNSTATFIYEAGDGVWWLISDSL